MEFDKNKVYTALNADELKVGSKIIVADNIKALKGYVKANGTIDTLERINNETCASRFFNGKSSYSLAYLISEPEEKKLKWTDLKIGDVIRSPSMIEYMITGIDRSNKEDTNIRVDGIWLTNEELRYWEKVE